MAFIRPDEKLDVPAIMAKFDGKCFACSKPVSLTLGALDPLKANFDHTRPAFYLWPLTTADATLLCRVHNGNKGQTWPGEFYSDDQIRRLSRLTGISYREMVGRPRFNPDALEILKKPGFVESLFENFAAYTDDVLNLRNRILQLEGFDFFDCAANISAQWRTKADERALRR